MKKVLFYSMGPGETAHAYFLFKYFKEKGHRIIFTLRQKINLKFFYGLELKKNIEVLPELSDLIQFVNKVKPSYIFLFNSKVFSKHKKFVEESPWPNIPTFSVDSNWLFSEKLKTYRAIRWINKYYICFPKKVFDEGLKENGGIFEITKFFRERIEIVGYLPTINPLSPKEKQMVRKILGIRPEEKFIFCYFSGFGAKEKRWVLEKLIRIVERLKKYRIKVGVVGRKLDIIKGRENFIDLTKRGVNIESYHNYLASSDLVFQHQGLGTLAQAITSRTPVIANVMYRPEAEIPTVYLGEVNPFAKLGLCKVFLKEDAVSKVTNGVYELLYNEEEIRKMKEAQKKSLVKGEQNLYRKFVSEYKL